MIASTPHRKFHDSRGHARPRSGVNDCGGPWTGCSRVRDRAARRRANRLTWAKEKAVARRSAIALTAARKLIAENAAS